MARVECTICRKDDYEDTRWAACYNCRNGNTPTRVVNRREELYDVFIGRPSKWGNPFKDLKRRDAIFAYRHWLIEQQDLMRDLPELKGKRLGCYCKPLACHGDVLVEFVEEYVCGCGEFRDEYPFCSACDGLEI